LGRGDVVTSRPRVAMDAQVACHVPCRGWAWAARWGLWAEGWTRSAAQAACTSAQTTPSSQVGFPCGPAVAAMLPTGCTKPCCQRAARAPPCAAVSSWSVRVCVLLWLLAQTGCGTRGLAWVVPAWALAAACRACAGTPLPLRDCRCEPPRDCRCGGMGPVTGRALSAARMRASVVLPAADQSAFVYPPDRAGNQRTSRARAGELRGRKPDLSKRKTRGRSPRHRANPPANPLSKTHVLSVQLVSTAQGLSAHQRIGAHVFHDRHELASGPTISPQSAS
jgi:hypothetical protein